VTVGLLVVIADELVALDEAGALLREPGGEAFVEVGARPLREALVRGVADQDVPKARGLLAGKLGPVGAQQLLPDEGADPAVEILLVRERRAQEAVVEDLPFDRRSLEHR